MPNKTHHIVPNSKGGWDIKKGGGERAIKHTETKEAAINFGREIAKNQGSELVIHKQNGIIQNTNSYGNDPCPPKDRKH